MFSLYSWIMTEDGVSVVHRPGIYWSGNFWKVVKPCPFSYS